MTRPQFFTIAVWIAVGVLFIVGPASEAQYQPELEALKKQISISERKHAYFELMNRGDAGYRVICDLIADSSLDFSQLINWEYDFSTRMDAPNAGIKFDDFMYRTAGSDKDFLNKMSEVFAFSLFSNQEFINMMKDERGGARLLGYSTLQIRYKNVPEFAFDAPQNHRDNQLTLIEKFLATQPAK